LPVT
jgi:hypothetical protein